MKALRLLLAGILLWLRRGGASEPRRPSPPDERSERKLPRDPRAETFVAVLFMVAALLGVGFFVLYVTRVDDTQLFGLALGLALAAIAVALLLAAKRVVPQETAVEERPALADDPAQREAEPEVAALIERGGEGVSRRALLTRTAGAAGVGLGLAAVAPLASLGPNVGRRIDQTPWRRGRGVVDEHGMPVLADEVIPGTFLTGFPAGADIRALGSPIVIVRVEPGQLHLPSGRPPVAWAPEGIVAYSQICTHAACAVALYRKPLFPAIEERAALVCPCHYSSFDPARGAEVIFGPAGRPLPQLPLAIDPGTRRLLCNGAFSGSIGPAWWSVRRGGSA